MSFACLHDIVSGMCFTVSWSDLSGTQSVLQTVTMHCNKIPDNSAEQQLIVLPNDRILLKPGRPIDACARQDYRNTVIVLLTTSRTDSTTLAKCCFATRKNECEQSLQRQLRMHSAEKAGEYQRFLQNQLRPDLQLAQNLRQACLQEQTEYQALHDNLQLLIQAS